MTKKQQERVLDHVYTAKRQFEQALVLARSMDGNYHDKALCILLSDLYNSTDEVQDNLEDAIAKRKND